MALPDELYQAIEEEVWSTAIACCCGYLSDGQPAKLPRQKMLPPSWPVEHEFADMEMVKLRVACVLKFYGHLTEQVAIHFEDLMHVCFSTAENLTSVNLDALPTYYRPLSPFFDFPKNQPGDFGEYLLYCYLPLAESHSQRFRNASWANLTTAAKVQCLERMNSQQRDKDEKRCAEFRPKRQQVREAIC
jgi:hypothetical protein